jgi:hypothetical protein
MVKHSHKRSKRYNKKSSKRYSRKMVGGFTPEETTRLGGLGFTQEHIDILTNTGVGVNVIEMSINQINPNTGIKYTPQELIDSVIEANAEIANFDENAVVPDQENEAVPNQENEAVPDQVVPNQVVPEQGPGLNMDDLAPESPRSVTEMGGRKRRRTMKKRRTTKKRTTKKRSQRGGKCYGSGVGANAYDPNYSIYNTNELQLFPYRTN